MAEFNKQFRYDDINGSSYHKQEAIKSAENFAAKVNGAISFKDGGPFILSINGRDKYYADPSDWPAVVVTYKAEKEVSEYE